MREDISGIPRQVVPGQVFDRAATLHRRGRLQEAAQLYRNILAADPNHFGALLNLAIITSEHGQNQQAEILIKRAVSLRPGSLEAHNAFGIVLARLSRFEEALAEYENALALDPRSIDALNNVGNTLHALRRSSEAVIHFERALALRPDIAELHNNLGNALRIVRREAEAVTSLRRAITLRPDYAEAHNNLGVALAALQRHEEAVAAYKQALLLKPHYFEAHHNLANALAASRRDDEAVAHFEAALAFNPHAAATYNSYGNALVAMNRQAQAVPHYLKAIELRPDFFEAHNNLGNALAASQGAIEAIPHYNKALEINPRYAEAHNNLGNVLGGLERYDEAIAAFQAALKSDPGLTEVYSSLASALITAGRIEEAQHVLERAIALDPRQPQYYRGIGECRRFTANDPNLAAMEKLANEIDTLSQEQRIVLHYTLAKACDDLGRYAGGFAHLKEGNRLRRSQIDYDEAAALRLHEQVGMLFTAELLRGRANLGDPSTKPVFVVGMPRSGTTLVEQVLASHPEVFGGGEMVAFDNAVASLAKPGEQPHFPDRVPSFAAEQFRAIGAHYVRHVSTLAPSARRIVDKALGNFVFVGLIHLALPHARIIHIRRDALDTCFSCFSKLFADELRYSYDLGELGRFYRSYQMLMAHWRRVLPKGAMLELDYEDLVGDLRGQTQRLLDYCDLDWDERCLSFHQTQRPVRTASATQVRRPLYLTSVGRSRPYKDMLAPLRDALQYKPVTKAARKKNKTGRKSR